MTKFKVGDIVVGNQDNELNGVEQGQLYEVVATEVAGGHDYILTNSSLGCWVLSERFDLYKVVPYAEQDDPLPLAPESGVYYSHNNDRRVTVLLEEGSPEGVIAVGTDASFMKVRLTAETALVLAHDLNRMANEIKRKERASVGVQ